MSRVIHCQLVRFGAMLVQCEFYSTMSLTGIEVKRVKAVDKDFCLSNDKGLRLLVAATGGRYRRLKHRYGGKQKTLAIGVYPACRLK